MCFGNGNSERQMLESSISGVLHLLRMPSSRVIPAVAEKRCFGLRSQALLTEPGGLMVHPGKIIFEQEVQRWF